AIVRAVGIPSHAAEFRRCGDAPPPPRISGRRDAGDREHIELRRDFKPPHRTRPPARAPGLQPDGCRLSSLGRAVRVLRLAALLLAGSKSWGGVRASSGFRGDGAPLCWTGAWSSPSLTPPSAAELRGAARGLRRCEAERRRAMAGGGARSDDLLQQNLRGVLGEGVGRGGVAMHAPRALRAAPWATAGVSRLREGDRGALGLGRDRLSGRRRCLRLLAPRPPVWLAGQGSSLSNGRQPCGPEGAEREEVRQPGEGRWLGLLFVKNAGRPPTEPRSQTPKMEDVLGGAGEPRLDSPWASNRFGVLGRN
ncbi:uncharacterized protein LOC103054165, partial [Python bivittatus]|uniref:Uncharacterized protein LOC103054165 n=1 Tax=Python bivittatus TaxID=176946 RepID=A0A9F2QWH7_PYTBI